MRFSSCFPSQEEEKAMAKFKAECYARWLEYHQRKAAEWIRASVSSKQSSARTEKIRKQYGKAFSQDLNDRMMTGRL